MSKCIAILGLGYVGLPVALAFGRRFPGTIGYDIDPARVAALARGDDWTGETSPEELAATQLKLTHDARDLGPADILIVCVPTPIDDRKRPNLEPLRLASVTAGQALRHGSIVVYESTVYPGLTEEFCVPILERESGLSVGRDFFVGYSPERINPGDRSHAFSNVTKVVSACNADVAATLAELYREVVSAGVHVAPSIKVAETAKVLENTQRDLNIALMNELALICDRLGIRTADVLAAAGTKWNFLPFTPGLVGGHCIGVDPYYLTTKAEALGYKPEVILAGRRINDGVGGFLAAKLVGLLRGCRIVPDTARVAILGLAFKEDIRDIRNSRVPDVVEALAAHGVHASVSDPLADAQQAQEAYGIALAPLPAEGSVDALVLAVPHRAYLTQSRRLVACVRPGGVVMDVKSVLDPRDIPADRTYWSL
ncbi:MAG: nucleotide sugar dehydrogenase [Alphaproteobacteria bacterium]|nr:nucleotide sugar dehydrogenase [Alphaproteobacteria bacterium]